MVHPKQDEHGKGGGGVPETRGVTEGSAKRIINRKNNPYDKKDKKNNGGGGGKGKWNDVDDGSMTYDDPEDVVAPTEEPTV
mmetsp:Transcript_16491/g.27363  ORF Transcript_16491/g.27363 Transcript_16491/m.27363 type:complete len:81 (+) Transcript_16491:70-312(+)